MHLELIKINGREKPFGTRLANGDVIEAVFRHFKNAMEEWEDLLMQAAKRNRVFKRY